MTPNMIRAKFGLEPINKGEGLVEKSKIIQWLENEKFILDDRDFMHDSPDLIMYKRSRNETIDKTIKMIKELE